MELFAFSPPIEKNKKKLFFQADFSTGCCKQAGSECLFLCHNVTEAKEIQDRSQDCFKML